MAAAADDTPKPQTSSWRRKGRSAPRDDDRGFRRGKRLPIEPTPAETAHELAPGWDSESSKRLADWASGGGPHSDGPPPDTTEWWKDPPQKR
jgi:hypothetical protein